MRLEFSTFWIEFERIYFPSIYKMGYPTANKASVARVLPDIAKNPAVFPDAANLEKMVSPASFTNAARQSMSDVFTLFKKGS